MIELYNLVEEAYQRISPVINKTPVLTSRSLNYQFNAAVYCKCENFQRMGAFKFRGAYNALSLLSPEEQKQGVITHSSGNHAQALALAAKELGIEATIVMPKDAPEVKKQATAAYGGKIIFSESDIDARAKMTQELINQYGYVLIHPYNYLPTIAGAGTVAYELIKEIDNLDYLLTPVGGGGLLSGSVLAAKGLSNNIKVIGVEPEQANDAYLSFINRRIFPSVNPNTIADGLRTSLGKITFKIIRTHVDNIITVSEEQIIEAMRFIWERMKIIVEPSGAVPLAGLRELVKTTSLDRKRIGLIFSGGNIDLTDFFMLLKQKFLKEGNIS